jgi:hypothetical protein
VPEVIAAIDDYIAHHNTKPKPFIWTKSARDILQKVIRANSRLSSKPNEALHQSVFGTRNLVCAMTYPAACRSWANRAGKELRVL